MFQRVLMVACVLLSAVTVGTAARANEPAHELLRKIGDVEIRRYAPFTVAEIEWPGPQARARSEAASVLNDYAAGDNELRRKVVFMPPLIVTRAPSAKDYWGRDRPSQGTAERPMVVQAVVGAGGDLSTLPVPTDARVRLRVVPPAVMAVLRFKGEASDREVDAQRSRLTAVLDEARVTWVGELLVGTYDRPFTPGFMRRNEVWLRVQPSSSP